MSLLERYWAARPFRYLATPGLHLLLLGTAIQVAAGLGSLYRSLRHLGQGPGLVIDGVVQLLSVAAVASLGAMLLLMVRDYRQRPDRPARCWQVALLRELFGRAG